VRPCGDALRPAIPQLPATGLTVALTLSGGGFRATLAGLGAIRYLAEAHLLGQLRYASSVSGGSIANAMLAKSWPELRREGFTAAAFDRILVDPVIRRISGGSLKRTLMRNVWRVLGDDTRTDLLADQFDEWSSTASSSSGSTPRCAGSSIWRTS
jgi:NTE family protein